MDGAEFDEVQAFLATFEGGSFAAASDMLNRDASIISRRVSALEARLATRLLERTTRRLAPTEAGNLFYRRMRSALSLMDEACAEVTETSSVASGLLRIALPATFGQRRIAPLLPAFLAMYPKITLEAEYSDRFVDLIHERFDLAIRVGNLNDSRLIARRLASNERIAVASPAYLERHGAPQTPDQLAAHACLANPRLEGYPDWRFRQGETVGTVRIRFRMTADDSSSLVAASVAGLGITVCARWLIVDEIASGALVPVLPDWQFAYGGGIHLIRPSARYTPSRTRVFVDWLVDQFKIQPW